MIKTKNYNNFPSDSELNVKPLDKDQTAMFRLINTFDPVSKKYFLRSELMPAEDFVTDPKTREGYHIACVKSVGVDNKVTFHEVWFEPNNIDIIRLSGKSAYDQEIYKYMKISNFNVTNPNRDPLAPRHFEEITPDTDVILPRTARKNKRAALILIDAMNDAEIIAFLKNNRQTPMQTEDLRRNQIEEFAERFPELVLKAGAYTSEDMAKDVEKFINADLIAWSKESASWYDTKTNNVILRCGKSFNNNAKDDIITFFSKNDEKYFYYQRKYLDMKHSKGESVVHFDKVEGISDAESDIMGGTEPVGKVKAKPFSLNKPVKV